LDRLDASGALATYHLLPAARADLLRRAGRPAEAAAWYARALDLARTASDRAYLRRRLAEVSSGTATGSAGPTNQDSGTFV
jgi:RNA polymerase sigma-70 factor (ECF subfamily)